MIMEIMVVRIPLINEGKIKSLRKAMTTIPIIKGTVIQAIIELSLNIFTVTQNTKRDERTKPINTITCFG